MSLLDSTEKLRRDRTLIEGLIDDPSRLGPDFQRIVRFADSAVVGHKATGRGQSGTDLDSTLVLLSSAQSTGLVERLDWAFRCLVFDVALGHPGIGEVHLTPEPETFGSPCPPRLATSFASGRRDLTVTAEVHDYGLSHPRLDTAVAEWRGWGWRVALADVAHVDDPRLLHRLDTLRPDVVQVDLNRPARDIDPRVREVLGWAAQHGAEVHAVGVDTAARQAAAVELGAVAGRGRLIGAPAPL